MIVLGIDPGTRFAGFGVLKKEKHRAYLLESGVLTLGSTKPLHNRVQIFYDFFHEKIPALGVTELALETPFLGKNAQNFLKLGYMRGLLYLLASQHNLNLHEFSPRQIKQSVTGYGGADKDQVARIVQRLFPNFSPKAKQDETDAVAVTLCCLWQGIGQRI